MISVTSKGDQKRTDDWRFGCEGRDHKKQSASRQENGEAGRCRRTERHGRRRRLKAGQKRERQDRRSKEQGITAGFPSTRVEDRTIPVFVLRRVCLRVGPAPKPRVEPSGDRDGAILQSRRSTSVRTIDEEAAWRLVSPSIEYHLTNYLTYVPLPESGSAPFWAHPPTHCRSTLVTYKLLKLSPGTEAKCQNKGGIFLCFILSPCLYLGLCGGASKY